MTTSSLSEKKQQIVPTANALESRLRIFQAVQARPKYLKDQTITTPWGTVKITGRLGQRHADLFESIRYCAEKTLERDGYLWILVDPHRIRETMGDHYSHQQVQLLLRDLMAAVIEYPDPTPGADEPALGHLIDDKISAGIERFDPLTKTTRKLWAIKIGHPGRKLLFEGIRLFYDPGPLARLKTGIGQGIARHVLGHKTVPVGGWKVDTLIEAVAGVITGTKLRNARRDVKDDMEGLREIGITVEEGRINFLLDENGFIDPDSPNGNPLKYIFIIGLLIMVADFSFRGLFS
jgi:hypothetical protein